MSKKISVKDMCKLIVKALKKAKYNPGCKITNKFVFENADEILGRPRSRGEMYSFFDLYHWARIYIGEITFDQWKKEYDEAMSVFN